MSNRADRADVMCLYSVALPSQNLALGFPPRASAALWLCDFRSSSDFSGYQCSHLCVLHLHSGVDVLH